MPAFDIRCLIDAVTVVVTTMPGSPARSLRSRRVDLAPAARADLYDIVALHRDARVTQHILDGIPDDPRKAGIYLDWAAALHARGIGPWTARRRSTGTFLGLFTLTPVDNDTAGLEFGGRLGRAGWHGDIAVEAGAALIEHAFATLGVPRLVSQYHGDNPTAPVALARLGFASPVATSVFGRPGIAVHLDAAGWAAQGRRPLPPRRPTRDGAPGRDPLPSTRS